MRLRRHKDEAGSATTGGDPGTIGAAPARRRSDAPAAGEISSVGVAIMPGMPLPDWVTAAALPEPTPTTQPPPDPAWPPADPRAPAQPLAAAYPQVDPVYEGLLAAAAAPQSAATAQPVATAPAFPQVDSAYEVALAAAPLAAGAPASGAELPPPDPAQWSEQPAGVVVWGPVPAPAPSVPVGAVPMQAPAFDSGPQLEPAFAAVESMAAAAEPAYPTVNRLATLPPPTGPAYDIEPAVHSELAADLAAPAEDAADLDAPDLEVPADEWSARAPVAELPPEAPEPDLQMWAPAAATASGVDHPAWQLDAPAAESAADPVDQPPAWFVTDVPEDAPPSPTSGAGQYGWLFQPDEPVPASETREAAHQPSATSWFDPAAADQPSWGAPAATVPVQWAGGAFDDAPAPIPQAEVQSEAPALAAAMAVPGLDPTAPPPLAAPVVPPSAAPVAPPSPPATPAAQASVTAPPAPAPVAPASVHAAPVPIIPPPARAVAPVAPAAAAPIRPPARPTTPDPVAVATPEPRQRRSRVRWLILAGIVALIAAAIAVSLFVFPGFLNSEPAATAAPTVATPATAGGLIRSASADGAVGPFRRTAAALGAAASSQYATYASEAGTTATIWDSSGTAASPAAIRAAYTSSGGRQLGPLVDVPAGPRGGSMACAAATATRTVCFWAGTGVAGAADIRGLGRSEAGTIAAKMRVALEQPA